MSRLLNSASSLRSRRWPARQSFMGSWRGALWAALLLGTRLSQAGYKDEIGLTTLLNELGGTAPSGAGIGVTQVESSFPYPSTSNYVADATQPELTGKTITPKNSPALVSGHATTVAINLVGSNNGTAPGVTQVDAYEANHWLLAGSLRYGNNLAEPVVETRRVQNHSWVAETAGALVVDQELLRRFDYAIHRDGFVAVVGLNNWNTNPVPALLAHAYNAISVGVVNGEHSSGGTTIEGSGRIKPELVSPSYYGGVSHATPTVAGAAALLLQKADATPGLALARTNSEVIKAVLLAGATKSQFPGWARTTTQPLDLVYGAGQLNVRHSYYLLGAGKFSASSSITVSNRGWDFAATSTSAARYFFDVPPATAMTNFSVVLTWNRKILDTASGATFSMMVSNANLNLRLYAASGFTPGTLLDSSMSTNQNVEHIFTPSLSAGRYCLEVTSDLALFDYALAWGGQPIVQLLTSVNQATWGSVTPASGLYSVGSNVGLTATPSPYYRFTHWTNGVTGATNPQPLLLTTNLSVTAVFAERFTTNYPTPYWWLASYGFTSNPELAVTNLTANGHPLWQSYVAGLNPTNPLSQLRFTSLSLVARTNLVFTWLPVSGRVYSIWSSSNSTGIFAPLPAATALPASISNFTNPLPPAPAQQYFRLSVENP